MYMFSLDGTAKPFSKAGDAFHEEEHPRVLGVPHLCQHLTLLIFFILAFLMEYTAFSSSFFNNKIHFKKCNMVTLKIVVLF